MSQSTNHFSAVCPNCLVSWNIEHIHAGRKVRCKQCNQKFRAYAPESTVPSASASTKRTGEASRPGGSRSERVEAICPHCSSSLSVRKVYAGHHVRCKICDEKFRVPSLSSPPAEVARPPGGFDPAPDPIDRDQQESPTAEPAEAGAEPLLAAGVAAVRPEVADHPHPARRERPVEVLKKLRDWIAVVEEARETALRDLQESRKIQEKLKQELRERHTTVEGLRADLASKERQHAESLQAEAERFQKQVEALEARLREHEGLADTLASREDELQEAGRRIEELGREIQTLEEARGLLASEKEPLHQELEQLREELKSAQSERDGFRDQFQSRDQALAGSEARIQGFTEQIRRHDEERLALAAEIERLQAELREAVEGAERHRGESSGREEALRRDLERLAAEADGLRRGLDDAERARHDLQARLEEQLRQDERQRQEAAAEVGSLQARVHELLELQGRERDEHQRALADREAALRAELEAERARHAELLAQAEAHRGESSGREVALRHEAERLGTEIESVRRDLAGVEQARRDEEARLGELLRLAEQRHQDALSEHGSLKARVQELLELQGRERDQHQRAIAAREEQLRSELRAALEAERARHAEQLAEVESHRGESSGREEALRRDLERLAAEADGLRRGLDDAERARHDLQARLEEQLRQDERQRQEAAAEVGSLQARVHELLELQARERDERQRAVAAREQELRAEHRAALEAERARHAEQPAQAGAFSYGGGGLVRHLESGIASLASAHLNLDDDLDDARREIDRLKAQLAEAQAATRAAEEKLVANAEFEAARREIDRLKAQLAEAQAAKVPARNGTSPAADDDPDAARKEIDRLSVRLAEAETARKSMASLLEGMGIRLKK